MLSESDRRASRGCLDGAGRLQGRPEIPQGSPKARLCLALRLFSGTSSLTRGSAVWRGQASKPALYVQYRLFVRRMHHLNIRCMYIYGTCVWYIHTLLPQQGESVGATMPSCILRTRMQVSASLNCLMNCRTLSIWSCLLLLLLLLPFIVQLSLVAKDTCGNSPQQTLLLNHGKHQHNR